MITAQPQRIAWALGAVGMLGCLIGAVYAPTQFPHAWLAALTCAMAWPLGSLALILIHALTGGAWGWAVRRELTASIATLPLLLPAALPILFGVHTLYPWMQPQVAARLDNGFYLNAPFFYMRIALYLLIWAALALLVTRALRRPDPMAALRRLAPPGLILLLLSVTFAAIDTTLSMQPQFKSSIFGMVVACEALLLALSLAVLGATLRPGREGAQLADLGKLLLALLVLWAYLDFMQGLIIWQSDLPQEAQWYVVRLTGGWSLIAAWVAGLHFVLPFFALLWPQVQRSRRALAVIAAVLVLSEIPRAWWTVIPAAHRGLSWLDGAAMLGLLGLSVALALQRLQQPLPAEPVPHG